MGLRGEIDDFSKWFADSLGQERLAERIKAVDPFIQTLEGIRAGLLTAVKAY